MLDAALVISGTLLLVVLLKLADPRVQRCTDLLQRFRVGFLHLFELLAERGQLVLLELRLTGEGRGDPLSQGSLVL